MGGEWSLAGSRFSLGLHLPLGGVAVLIQLAQPPQGPVLPHRVLFHWGHGGLYQLDPRPKGVNS